MVLLSYFLIFIFKIGTEICGRQNNVPTASPAKEVLTPETCKYVMLQSKEGSRLLINGL